MSTSSSLLRPCWRIAVVLATALISACSTVTVAPDPLKTPPKADESAVVVSVTGNTAQVTAITTLTVERIQPDASKVKVYHTMTQVAPGLSRDTSLFIGVLPAGEYELSSLSNQQTQRSLTLSTGMRQLLGRFTVIAGKPADLGRLVMTPVNFKVMVGRSARITSNVEMMRRFAPEQAKLFASELGGGWKDPRHAEDRTEEYALHRPVGADQPVELADGKVVVASRLGTVLVRSTDGRWRASRAEGLESLLSVMPVSRPDADLLAVGEFSTLLRRAPGSDRLVAIDTGDLPPGNLMFIDGNDSSGWYIAHQKGDDITLFRSARLEAGQWQAVRKEKVGMDFWNGGNAFWIWRMPGGLGYAVSAGSIQLLDYGSGQWTTRKAPNDNRLLAIASNPNGSLGVLTSPGGGFGGIFAGLYLSKDDGKTWQEIKSEFKVKVAPPRQMPDGTLLLPGGVFSQPELHASKDEGRTWKRVGEFQLGRQLVLLSSGGLLAIDAGQNGVFGIGHSSDGGASWTYEYSNFDRAAYEAQEQRKK